MPRIVVVLPVGGAVLPVAALPALRATAQVFADTTIPEKVALAAGAVADSPSGTDWVLLTTDLTQAPAADDVIGAPRGTALLDAAAVMDRLRSPGGCPWDAEQTHASLLPYLVEECYELYQAIEDGDGAAVREELGDVLLQVLFHARVASEAELREHRPIRARRAEAERRSTSTTWPPTWWPSSSAATRTCSRSDSRSGSTPRSARSTAGRSSSGPRSSATPAWTACRSASRPSRWRRS